MPAATAGVCPGGGAFEYDSAIKDTGGHREAGSQWSPYVDNGGTVMALAGSDYAVIVADTRLSLGYSIQSRNDTKMTRLTEKAVIATSGMQADAKALHKNLKIQIAMYRHNNDQEPSLSAVARLLSTVLYSRRFFPYYTFNILAGVHPSGVGAVYGYDAIGSMEELPYGANGTGASMIMPVLDNQVLGNNQKIAPAKLDRASTIDLAKDLMTSACERDIYTGDQAEVAVIDSMGISRTYLPLRRD